MPVGNHQPHGETAQGGPLKRELGERHIRLMALGACIGVGLFLGSLCTKTIADIPLYGALVLAILVISYKRFVPDISPLPHGWHSLSLVVSFISIMLGAYIQKRKA